jgi:quercetin dioxygenase-like cupin family protein
VAVIHDAHVLVLTDRFTDDFTALTERFGFRVDVIFPADDPATAIVSGHGVRLRLERSESSRPILLDLLTDAPGDPVELPGGTILRCRPAQSGYVLPHNQPTLTIVHDDGAVGIGRAGMRYRDLIPDRWGGRFISSLISIPGGGPVPDYVHFHKIRFQLIFVKSGWVRLVYEGQGEPFVLHPGDCVIQPPEIRHRVLESSPGLQVVEIGCPAEHETIADWSMELPSPPSPPDRAWEGQRFVRHVAAGAAYQPWRLDGWEYRESGVEEATSGLAGVRVARPVTGGDMSWVTATGEFSQLVVLDGSVLLEVAEGPTEHLVDGSSVALPSGTRYRLLEPTSDCELLDVTLPA